MKFIHLTDTHVVGSGLLYGQDPAERLAEAVTSINAEHSDAEFVIVTGDMTHWGDADAYTRFAKEITKLKIPFHLMVGNHDDTPALMHAFPDYRATKTALCRRPSTQRTGVSCCSTRRLLKVIPGPTATSVAIGWPASWRRSARFSCSCITPLLRSVSKPWTQS